MKKLYNKVNREVLKKRLENSSGKRTTLSFYKYAKIESPASFRDYLYKIFDELGVLGRIYVAEEGVNAQVSVPEKRVAEFREKLNSISIFEGIRLNIAIDDDGKSFFKLTVKVRPKIVADGLEDDTFDVTRRGRHLSASEVNELMAKEETVVIDMRNHYESEVGHFEGAICPDVETFREALPLVENELSDKKDRPMIMYCTGGIRCEKASAWFLHRGFNEVYMIDGGIIEYSRQCEREGLENKFIGKNFVFDERLGERISEDVIARCHQCGSPCDKHTNCANDACHLLFIQCEECAEKYDACCSRKCAEFIRLPEEDRNELKGKVEFNGSRFGKGRYKAQRKDEPLRVD